MDQSGINVPERMNLSENPGDSSNEISSERSSENSSERSSENSSERSSENSSERSSGSSSASGSFTSGSSSLMTLNPASGSHSSSRMIVTIPELIVEDSDLAELPLTNQFVRGLMDDPDAVDPVTLACEALVKLEHEEWLLNPQVNEPPKLVKRPERKSLAAKGGVESTLCSAESLSELRGHFLILDEVEFRVPSPSDRAGSPPGGFFTLYEGFFYETFLWFPIPSVIFEFLDLYSIALSQLTPRSVRHLFGLIIRSYEEDVVLTAEHIDALLSISSGNKDLLHYFLSARVHRKIIKDFPNKDTKWWRWFFFVRKNEASVCGEALHLVRGEHSPIGSSLARFFERSFFVFDI